MFQKGDLIVYGNMGVCRVEAVEAPAGLPGAGEKKLYYKLDPVYETGTVYIPVDAKVFMRPILTHAQAEALIGRIPEIEENPCGGKDQQMLAEHYRSLMRTHDCDDLVQLIKTIYGKNRERTAQGKKPARTEAEYMKRAEELLHGELAAALGISFSILFSPFLMTLSYPSNTLDVNLRKKRLCHKASLFLIKE